MERDPPRGLAALGGQGAAGARPRTSPCRRSPPRSSTAWTSRCSTCPDEVSARWAPIAAARGAVAVDNSGAFRMDPDVPLVVPEVNADDAADRPKGIIANPNCTTLSMMAAMGALHREFELDGAGRGVLPGGVGRRAARDRPAATPSWPRSPARTSACAAATSRRRWPQAGLPAESPFPAPLALNVVPWAGSLKDDGWSSEELKVRNESRKILGIPDLKVSATCVRVPGGHHALAGRARDLRPRGVGRRRAQGARRAADGRAARRPGGRASGRRRPTSSGGDPTWVGRIRQALDFPNTLELFVCGDNLRKGAALNTYEIAETVAAGLDLVVAGRPPSGNEMQEGGRPASDGPPRWSRKGAQWRSRS